MVEHMHYIFEVLGLIPNPTLCTTRTGPNTKAPLEVSLTVTIVKI